MQPRPLLHAGGPAGRRPGRGRARPGRRGTPRRAVAPRADAGRRGRALFARGPVARPDRGQRLRPAAREEHRTPTATSTSRTSSSATGRTARRASARESPPGSRPWRDASGCGARRRTGATGPQARAGPGASPARRAGGRRRRRPGSRPAPRALARPTRSRRSPTPSVGLAARPTPARRRRVVFFAGAARVREDEAVLGPGCASTLLVRRAASRPRACRATVGGEGACVPPVCRRSSCGPTGGLVDLPLVAYHEVRGRDGRRAVFTRTTLTVDGQARAAARRRRRSTAPPATGPAADLAEAARENGTGRSTGFVET